MPFQGSRAFGWKEGRTEGMKEGGRKEGGRKEGRKERIRGHLAEEGALLR